MCALGDPEGNVERQKTWVQVSNKDDLDQSNDHELKEGRTKKQVYEVSQWDPRDGLNMENERLGVSFLNYPTTHLLYD